MSLYVSALHATFILLLLIDPMLGLQLGPILLAEIIQTNIGIKHG